MPRSDAEFLLDELRNGVCGLNLTGGPDGARNRLSSDLGNFFRDCPSAHYPTGAYVCMPVDPADCLFYVQSGCVKLKAYTLHGDERVLDYIYPGQTFCEPGVLVGKRYGVAAEAVRPSVVGWLKRTEVENLLQTHSEFASALLRLTAMKLRWFTGLMVSASYRTAVEQLASTLLHLGRAQQPSGQGAAEIPISQAELARYIGVSRGSVTLALTQLEGERLAQRRPGGVEVPDMGALVRWLEKPRA